jgi:hypothetical protein
MTHALGGLNYTLEDNKLRKAILIINVNNVNINVGMIQENNGDYIERTKSER